MDYKQPHAVSPERAAFYDSLAPRNLAPLWEMLAALITPEPATPAVPVRWRFSEVRPFLTRAGEIISAREAERRVLVLENPALRGRAAITNSLYAGLQLILPGEVAPAHRHSQAALRFVMEGEGAYTSVNGVRAEMHVGDLILTPSWTWHSHGNETDRAMVWLDGLDVPLVSGLDAGFSEKPASGAALTPTLGAPHRDGAARGVKRQVCDTAEATEATDATSPSLRRVRRGAPHARAGAHFIYPHAQWREALHRMSRGEALDAHDAFRMEFVNPADGSPAMPTMSAFCQLIPKGMATRPLRSTDGSVYVVTEGEGRAGVGEQTFDLAPGDIFVVPSWSSRTFTAASDLVLFSFSDRATQQALALWREQLQ
jgi:gentisate 1,2-dioxygenase